MPQRDQTNMMNQTMPQRDQTNMMNQTNNRQIEELGINYNNRLKEMESLRQNINVTIPTITMEPVNNNNKLVEENKRLKGLLEQKELLLLNNSILNQREQELNQKELEIKQLLSSYITINNVKNISHHINMNESKYTYRFEKLDNISSIKLLTYSLPNIRYNINNNNNIFRYSIDNDIKEIKVNKGNYIINRLLKELTTDDITFSLDVDEMVTITSTKNITLLECNLLNCLGFNTNMSGNNIKAERIYDLRYNNKILLYIRNIDKDYPVGVLYNNNMETSIELNFNNMLSLDSLELELRDENNDIYDLNGLDCRISFMLGIDLSKIFAST
jgi:hypothetical protein